MQSGIYPIIRNRKQVNQNTITAIQTAIHEIIVNYKKAHDGFFDGMKYATIFEILDKLDIELASLSDSDTLFLRYSKMLDCVYFKFKSLNKEKEIDLIRKFQNILVEQVQFQVEADWMQTGRAHRLQTRDLDSCIGYSLSKLRDAATYESARSQSFANKWKGVYGTPEEYRIWMYLCENFKSQIDEGHITTLLSSLRIHLGLLETSMDAGVNKSIYDLNMAGQNRFSQIWMFPDDARMPHQAERLPGILYFKKHGNEAFKVYIFEEKNPIILGEKEYRNLLNMGLNFFTEEIQKISDKNFVSKVALVCAVNEGCLEKIINDAGIEISGLHENNCAYFCIKQEKIIEILNNRIQHSKIGHFNCDQKNIELKNVRFLLENKEKFDKGIIKQLDKLGECDDVELNECQRRVFQRVKDELNRKLEIYKLYVLIQEIKLNGDKIKIKELIQTIKTKDKLFSDDIRRQVDALEKQLEIWSFENLKSLCVEYLRHHISLQYDERPIIDNPCTVLVNKFIYPVINNLINPLLSILNKDDIEFDCSCTELIKDFETIYKNKLDEKNLEIQPQSWDYSIAENSQYHFVVDAKQVEEEKIQLAMKAAYLTVNEMDQSTKDNIKNNVSLQLALSASYLYYTDKDKGYTHGDHGKDATILFITNLLMMTDLSHRDIQNEALKYIRGEGGYGNWRGGASGCQPHSRIAFILDSGLLDDRSGELYPYKTVSKSKFFNHNQSFSDLEKEKREDLSLRLSLLNI